MDATQSLVFDKDFVRIHTIEVLARRPLDDIRKSAPWLVTTEMGAVAPIGGKGTRQSP